MQIEPGNNIWDKAAVFDNNLFFRSESSICHRYQRDIMLIDGMSYII